LIKQLINNLELYIFCDKQVQSQLYVKYLYLSSTTASKCSMFLVTLLLFYLKWQLHLLYSNAGVSIEAVQKKRGDQW